MKNIIIAIDGLSGVGKGTIAKSVADRLNILYVESGMYYRVLTYYMIKQNIAITDISGITKTLNEIIDNQDKYFANIKQVDIRNNEVNDLVADVSCIKEVRVIINDYIRKEYSNKSLVIDGRDTTSLIFPDADVKIYLDASAEVRASRRQMQNKETYENNTSLDTVLENIKKRDEVDFNRGYGALKKVSDAHIIDTTNKTISETVEEILNIIEGEVK